ncbi:MAG: transposase [Nitrospirae bacterium]|nr:transposase [Nitrospirota bacterium]
MSRCAYETVREMMQAAGLPLRGSNATGSEDNTAVPGMIVAIQTFGSSDIHWYPHLHCLVTNGAFTPDGTFHAMEILSPSVIMEILMIPCNNCRESSKCKEYLLLYSFACARYAFSSIRYSGCCSRRD